MWKRLIEAIIFRITHGPATLGPAPIPLPMPPFEIAKLDLKAGDYLVVRFRQKLTLETADRLKTQLAGAGIVQKGKILVFEGGADLAVLTPPQAEPDAPHLAAT